MVISCIKILINNNILIMVFLCKYFVSYMIRIIIWKQKYVYCMGEYSFIVDIYIYIYISYESYQIIVSMCIIWLIYVYIYIYIYWLLGSIRSNPILASSKQIHTHTHTYIYIIIFLKNRFTTHVSACFDKFSFCLLSLYLFYFIVSPLLSFYFQDSHLWMHSWVNFSLCLNTAYFTENWKQLKIIIPVTVHF